MTVMNCFMTKSGYVCLLCLLVAGGASAWADPIYRWTDADGVVHFSDVRPASTPSSTLEIADRLAGAQAAGEIVGPVGITSSATPVVVGAGAQPAPADVQAVDPALARRGGVHRSGPDQQENDGDQQ